LDDQDLASLEKARDTLVAELLDRPDVVMIDVSKDEAHGVPVLRVHVRGTAGAPTGIPSEIDGIPVQVLSGDYRLEESEP
jgi:hypothetical protein